jgi:TM2 domain-containing membrane protein YozV
MMTAEATTFCGRCGEREDRCVCARSSEVFEQLRAQAKRAAKAVEAPAGSRSPVTAALLSLVLPGLGQLYNGDVLKGIVFFVGWVLVVPWALAVMDAYYGARVSNLEERLRVLESN